jgi:hypothetical protein
MLRIKEPVFVVLQIWFHKHGSIDAFELEFGFFILSLQSIFQSEEAHFKSIGYREDGENLEYKSFFFKLKYRRLFKPARIIYKVVWCIGAGLSMS